MVRTVLSLIFLMAFSLSAAAQSNRALHDRLITFDAEMDIPYEFMTGPNDVGQDTAMHVDLPKMDRGGLDGALFVSWVSQGERTPSAYAKAKADADIKFKAIEAMVEKYPDRIGLAKSADEAEQLVTGGKHFAVMGMVNAWPLGPDRSWLLELYDRGLRNITLNHAGHNQFSDSSRPRTAPPMEHGGLSRLGRQLIRTMNDMGIIVDVSQVTSQTVFQVTELSRAPIIASHSGIKAIIDTARNLTDAEMVAIKETGGGVGIVAFSNYLQPVYPGQSEAFLESGRKRIVYFHNLASLRMKTWMLAIRSQARALSTVALKSFARRRLRPNHAKVRSTTQRRGSATKPSALSLRLTISSAQSPIFFSAPASLGPA